MQATRDVPKRFGDHDNAFGALRLLFASLVIASHAVVLVDGDYDREILTAITGSMTFAKLAVIGFFVISGYLITGSLLNSRPLDYLVKRIARIYPAYLVAFLLSIVIVAPLAGAAPPNAPGDIAKRTADALALQVPWVPGAFEGQFSTTLNGSMWTIAYEFRCYLLILLFGLFGLLRRPRVIIAITAILLALMIAFPTMPATNGLPMFDGPWGVLLNYAIGEPYYDVRFIGAFLTGTLFYLYRERLRFTWVTIALAVVGLVVGTMFDATDVAAAVVFGGYLVFATAKRATWLYRINNRNDISYGVYLYAWPITQLLIWRWPGISPLAVGLVTLAGAWLCGWASWLAIEKPALEFARRWPRTSVVAA